MNRCPITYEEAEVGLYSKKGLRLLSTGLRQLEKVGVEPDSVLESKNGVSFYQADVLSTQDTISAAEDGNVIAFVPIKSGKEEFLENMDVTLKILSLAGVETAQGGLVVREDNSRLLVIRRPEAHGKRGRHETSDINCDSIDTVKSDIIANAAFPLVEFQRLLTRIAVSYLVAAPQSGFLNLELMNTKGQVSLKPAMWVWNTDLFSGDFPNNDPIADISPENLFTELGAKHFGLPEKVVEIQRENFSELLPKIYALIEVCFLSDEMKEEYLFTIDERWAKLGF